MVPITLTLLTTAAVLIGFLVYRVWQRVRIPIVRERQWIGHGFEPGSLTLRIQRLRADYAAAARAHRVASGYHDELIARTRHMVAHLAFFQARPTMETAVVTTAVETQRPPD